MKYQLKALGYRLSLSVVTLGMLQSPMTFAAQKIVQPTLGVAIAAQAGTYDIIDRGKINQVNVDFSKVLQAQDAQLYQKVTAESYEAYAELYGTCGGASYKTCTGLQKLRRINYQTVKSHSIAYVSADELNQAISDFLSMRDKLTQKLAATEVLKDVWQGFSNSSGNSQTQLAYHNGSLNLKALADVYRDGIAKMEKEANGLTYKYFNGAAAVTSPAGMGLEPPATIESVNVIQQNMDAYEQQLKLNSGEKYVLRAMHHEMTRQMVNFIDTNGKKLVWYTNGQNTDKAAWAASMENKVRIMSWVRGVYCWPIGVNAVEVPDPKAFNVDFLKRGLDQNNFRVPDAMMTEESDIRHTISNLDRLLVSVQSQAGEFNNVGGFMGYVNRLNSTFTWHNQVEANLNVIKMLRGMMQDEADLLSADPAGCDKVRARYNSRYGSFFDAKFQNIIDRYLGGQTLGGDNTVDVFNRAGKIIFSHGKVYAELKKLERGHPELSPSAQALQDIHDIDPSLK